jgi:electron transfer flavoprotein alpha subunit
MSDSIWCVAEVRRGKAAATLFELLSGARALSPDGEICAVLLGGPGTAEAAEEAALRGADKVLFAEDPALEELIDDVHASALESLARARLPKALLFPATVFGRSVAPRLAVALRTSCVTEATALLRGAEGRLEAERTAFAGSMLTRVELLREPAIATVRPLSFPQAGARGKAGEVERVRPEIVSSRARWLSFQPEHSREIDIGSADKIVSGGRGLGKADGFDLLRRLAGALGAAVGSSRSAVDSGWIPYRHQVGLTGRSVRPRLYLACGISGQVQHMAGMRSSGVVVAVNTDPEAPIMRQATLSVQGDLYEIVPALLSEIEKIKGRKGSADLNSD